MPEPRYSSLFRYRCPKRPQATPGSLNLWQLRAKASEESRPKFLLPSHRQVPPTPYPPIKVYLSPIERRFGWLCRLARPSGAEQGALIDCQGGV